MFLDIYQCDNGGRVYFDLATACWCFFDPPRNVRGLHKHDPMPRSWHVGRYVGHCPLN